MSGFPRRRRVYLMRHGAVSYFDETGTPLPSETVPLSPKGVGQAEAAAEALAHIEFDRVLTSSLPRTRETARIVQRDRGLVPTEVAELREIRPGKLREIPESELEETFTQAFAAVTLGTRFLNGETFESFCGRILPNWQAFRDDPTWTTALVVLHGGVNRLILGEALGIHVSAERPTPLGALEQDPACINVLDVADDGSSVIRLVNFTPHARLKEGIRLTTMEELLLEYRPR